MSLPSLPRSSPALIQSEFTTSTALETPLLVQTNEHKFTRIWCKITKSFLAFKFSWQVANLPLWGVEWGSGWSEPETKCYRTRGPGCNRVVPLNQSDVHIPPHHPEYHGWPNKRKTRKVCSINDNGLFLVCTVVNLHNSFHWPITGQTVLWNKIATTQIKTPHRQMVSSSNGIYAVNKRFLWMQENYRLWF